jgi:hypothetical protein
MIDVDSKDVIIAVLVAYLILDISFSFTLKKKRPILFLRARKAIKKERGALLKSMAMAVVAGGIAYYISREYI